MINDDTNGAAAPNLAVWNVILKQQTVLQNESC